MVANPMSDQAQTVTPGPEERSVRSADGQVLWPPHDWVLVPPGDAALTRRIKAAGPSWTVVQKKGRKVFSHGVWAPGGVVEAARRELAAERTSPQYARKRAADAQRRQREQAEYVAEFEQAVLSFLAFDPRHGDLGVRLARAVAEHATPVGSGTVARTRRIPLSRRAEAAVLAWMRHQTTAYDHMSIPRVKGRRRQVRRLLAERSRALLEAYRQGKVVDEVHCPLQQALTRPAAEGGC
jgi:hypothetical protein